MDIELQNLLREYAARYETADFLDGDPSWFVHQVSGDDNQATLGFVASCLSYGSRQQFMPKIQYILDRSHGETAEWVRSGAFAADIPDDISQCYYRLYTYHAMHTFLNALREMIVDYGSLKSFVAASLGGSRDSMKAIEALTSYFASRGIEGIVPKNTQSSCKRICMFLRWMVRDGSPVDLGIWSDILDKRTLIMPMDTHVVQQSCHLGLLSSRSASMSAARRLTAQMLQVFPDDPLKGDFALFGHEVNSH